MLKQLQRSLVSYLRNSAGIHVYRGSLPHGVSFLADVRRAFPATRLELVFDVGANTGQFAEHVIRTVPDVRVYSFEPVQQTFQILEKLATEFPQLIPVALALGESRAEQQIYVDPNQLTISSLLDNARRPGLRSETVHVTTLDSFCDEKGIPQIDLLKIDVEGFELQVLKGSKARLSNGSIGMIYIECELLPNPETRFASLEEIANVLAPDGYELLGIYEQQARWSGRQSLFFANAAFVHARLLSPDN